MYSNAYIWAKVLAYLEEQLTPTMVSTWFDDLEIVDLTDTTLYLYTPSPFRKDTIQNRWLPTIQEAMLSIFQMKVDVVLTERPAKSENKPAGEKPEFLEKNPQYTFSSYVVGASNRFAHGAALAVANNPAETYNPLFIYGPSGLGKTHLLYAIAAEIYAKHPNYQIVYIRGDQFTYEMIEAIRDGKNAEFRNKFRNADLFLVDDIHFIAGKDSTQEEFFNTFNALYENHKQIVLTSDQPPSGMLKLEDRLKTRFEWGLIADIQPPDYETRVAIIQNKARLLGIDIPTEVCTYIAENITTNIRQIEGTVKKVMAYQSLNHIDLTLSNVSKAIRDMYKDNSSSLPTPPLIIREVCNYYSLEEDVLRGTLRNRGTAEARQIAMYLIRSMTQLSLPDIGKEFGRDHTTVLHAINKVEAAKKAGDSKTLSVIQTVTTAVNNNL